MIHQTAIDVLLLEIKDQERHLTEIRAGRSHHIQMAQTCQDRATATLQAIEDLNAAVRQLLGGVLSDVAPDAPRVINAAESF